MCRAVTSLSPSRPTLPVYIVRHGVTAWNHEGLIQGWTDIPLSDRGRAQAERLAGALAGVRIGKILTSTLQRARETAEIVARPHGLTVEVDADLREYHCGDWEGRPYLEIRATERDRFLAWFNDPDVPMPGGESMNQSRVRAMAALRRRLDGLERARAAERQEAGRGGLTGASASSAEPERDAPALVLVAHGGVNRLIAADLLGVDLSVSRRLRLDNASISVLEPFLDAYALKLWNSTAHLDGLSMEGEGDSASRVG